MNSSDQHLVKQALAGKQRAFGELIKKYETAVYAIAYRWTGNAADAQDLAQECFTRAFEQLDQLQEPAKFAGWLRTIAVNFCRMWRRQRDRADALAEEDIGDALYGQRGAIASDAAVERREIRRTAIDLIDSLSDKVALTARLFYVDGLSYGEIADVLDLKMTTVEGRLHKARVRLRNALAERYSDSAAKRLLIKLTSLSEGGRKMDAIRIEVGVGLVPLVANEKERNMLKEIGRLRKDLEADERMVMPPVRVVDKNALPEFGYAIHFHEALVGEGELPDEGVAIASLCDHLKNSVLEHRDEFKV